MGEVGRPQAATPLTYSPLRTLPAEDARVRGRPVRLPGAKEDSKLPATVRWANTEGIGVQFGLMGAKETHLLTEVMRAGKTKG